MPCPVAFSGPAGVYLYFAENAVIPAQGILSALWRGYQSVLVWVLGSLLGGRQDDRAAEQVGLDHGPVQEGSHEQIYKFIYKHTPFL